MSPCSSEIIRDDVLSIDMTSENLAMKPPKRCPTQGLGRRGPRALASGSEYLSQADCWASHAQYLVQIAVRNTKFRNALERSRRIHPFSTIIRSPTGTRKDHLEPVESKNSAEQQVDQATNPAITHAIPVSTVDRHPPIPDAASFHTAFGEI